MTAGMDERTGRVLDGRAYAVQSIRRALTTPRGTMPMARSRGISLRPGALSPVRIAALCAETVEALEDARLPIEVEAVRPVRAAAGHLRIHVRVLLLDEDAPDAHLEVIVEPPATVPETDLQPPPDPAPGPALPADSVTWDGDPVTWGDAGVTWTEAA